MNVSIERRLRKLAERSGHVRDRLDYWAMNIRPHPVFCGRTYTVSEADLARCREIGEYAEREYFRKHNPQEERSAVTTYKKNKGKAFYCAMSKVAEIGVAIAFNLPKPDLSSWSDAPAPDLVLPDGSTVNVKSVESGYIPGINSWGRDIREKYAIAAEVNRSDVRLWGWIESREYLDLCETHPHLGVSFVPWTKMNLGFLPPSVRWEVPS